MTEPLDQAELAVLLAYTGSLCLMFLYHFYRATFLWRREKTVRSFRNWIIATLLAFATCTLFTGSLARLFPELVEAVRFFGYIVRGMLLLGGVTVVYTWLREKR